MRTMLFVNLHTHDLPHHPLRGERVTPATLHTAARDGLLVSGYVPDSGDPEVHEYDGGPAIETMPARPDLAGQGPVGTALARDGWFEQACTLCLENDIITPACGGFRDSRQCGAPVVPVCGECAPIIG